MIDFWWIYIIAALALFILLLKIQRIIKRNFTITGEEEKITEEITSLLKEKELKEKELKGKELEKEKKKIRKEIEILVEKAEELIELSQEETKKEEKAIKKKKTTKPKQKPPKEHKTEKLELEKFLEDVRKKLR